MNSLLSVYNPKQIAAIHASSLQAALVIAGGGGSALAAMLAHPGASRFVLEAQIPYSRAALADYLGESAGHVCSSLAAGKLAKRALARAQGLAPDSEGVLGIACTAALRTDRERKGTERAHFCIRSKQRNLYRLIELPVASRAEQEQLISEQLLDYIFSFTRRAV